MIIAPRIQVKDWKSLNLKNKKFSGEWEEAIGIFEKKDPVRGIWSPLESLLK